MHSWIWSAASLSVRVAEREVIWAERDAENEAACGSCIEASCNIWLEKDVLDMENVEVTEYTEPARVSSPEFKSIESLSPNVLCSPMLFRRVDVDSGRRCLSLGGGEGGLSSARNDNIVSIAGLLGVLTLSGSKAFYAPNSQNQLLDLCCYVSLAFNVCTSSSFPASYPTCRSSTAPCFRGCLVPRIGLGSNSNIDVRSVEGKSRSSWSICSLHVVGSSHNIDIRSWANHTVSRMVASTTRGC